MQLSQVGFEESEGGSLAVIKSRVKGANRGGEEKDVQDKQYNAQYGAVTAVFPSACADLWKPTWFSGYLNCSHTTAAGCPAAASVGSL